MSARRTGAMAARPSDKEAERARVDPTKTRRYWAGKAPEWLQDQQLQDLQLGDKEAQRTEIAAPVIVRKADSRLDRLRARGAEDVEEARDEHRAIRAAEIVRRRHEDEESDELAAPSGSEAGDEEQQPTAEDEEEQLQHRQAVRDRLILQQRAAEAAKPGAEEEEEEEEDDDSEYETDSEDEVVGRRLLKPIFVPKQARETIAERDAVEKQENEAVEREKKRLDERKVETRQLVAETIAFEIQTAKAAVEEANKGIGNAADINTDDDADQVEEFEGWKVRELERIRREHEAKDKAERDATERDRLKNMTDDERRIWEAANPKQQGSDPSKKKWKYLQKYWHKGAFFQEAPDDDRGTTDKEEILERDYSAPTGEDKFNKELLPKIMQVKNFGRSGRTKWTHLLNEDTTQMLAPLALPSADRKRFGTAEEFAKPKKFKT